jgi:hypothetical protein
MSNTGHWRNLGKGQAGENNPAIYFLPKNSPFGYWFEGGQIKIIGMRVGERDDYIKDWFKPIFPIFLTWPLDSTIQLSIFRPRIYIYIYIFFFFRNTGIFSESDNFSAYLESWSRESSVGIATLYGLDVPGIESRWGARFSAPVQTGSRAYPASHTMSTGSLSRR